MSPSLNVKNVKKKKKKKKRRLTDGHHSRIAMVPQGLKEGRTRKNPLPLQFVYWEEGERASSLNDHKYSKCFIRDPTGNK
jgi:hypothetical protein